MKNYLFLIFILLLTACNKPSNIEVRNNLSEASLKSIYWGEISIAYEILPGETSGKVKLYEDAQFNLDFPEEYPLRFYIELNGIDVLVQTDEFYKLGNEDDLYVEITDTIKVSEIK